jgi:hypothetical protein
MKDVTIRGLVAAHGLKLGDRDARDTGNPRYDLADCARVFMLHMLIIKIGMRGETAVWAVNKAYDHLKMIAEGELAAIDSGEAPDCPRYELRLPAMSLDVETNPDIRLHSAAEAKADRAENRGRWCEVVMDLREIVRGARDALVNQLGHSTSGLRHDFADAPDPLI